MIIMRRRQVLVNTDPERRCYDGCHARSELVWEDWEDLEEVSPEKVDARLKFWRGLNEYAVKSRGAGALIEYKIQE